jgi:hypothetical protein
VATRRRPPTRRSPARHPLPPSRERSSEPHDPIGTKAEVGAERLDAETQPGPAPTGAIASGRLRKSDGHAGELRRTAASSACACSRYGSQLAIRAALLSAQSETPDSSPVMLLAERKQGAQPHPAESRSKTRLTSSRREFCLCMAAEVSPISHAGGLGRALGGSQGRNLPPADRSPLAIRGFAAGLNREPHPDVGPAGHPLGDDVLL